VDAWRLLLDDPSADPAAMLAFDSAAAGGRGYSALIGAVFFARWHGSPARPFAPFSVPDAPALQRILSRAMPSRHT
jgi:hypothetical protein